MQSNTGDEPTDEQIITEFVKVATRSSQFNFDEVCRALKEFCSWRQLQISEPITAELCRKIFADDYYSPSVSNDMRPIEPQKPILLSDNMSFDEMMEVIAQDEERNLKKKEEIFLRVLSSLKQDGNSQYDEGNVIHQSNELSIIMKAIQDRKATLEAERLKRQEYLLEQEERKALELQRDALRKRFDKGSVDSEGIDPFADRTPKKHFYDLEMKTYLDVDVSDFNINEVLESKEFDRLLSDLEDELFPQAPSKDDPEFSSPELQELFELIRMESSSSQRNYQDEDIFYFKNRTRKEQNLENESEEVVDDVMTTDSEIRPVEASKMLCNTVTDLQSASIPKKDGSVSNIGSVAAKISSPSKKAIARSSRSNLVSNSVKDVKERRRLDYGGSPSGIKNISVDSTTSDLSYGDSNDYDEDDWKSVRMRQKNRIADINTETGNQVQSVWGAFGTDSLDYSALIRSRLAEKNGLSSSKIQEVNVEPDSDTENEPAVNITNEEMTQNVSTAQEHVDKDFVFRESVDTIPIPNSDIVSKDEASLQSETPVIADVPSLRLTGSLSRASTKDAAPKSKFNSSVMIPKFSKSKK